MSETGRSQGNRPLVRVRMATTGDYLAWYRLWQGYLAFYEASVPTEVTQATWRRCLSDVWPMDCLVAVVDGDLVGFAIVVTHPGTWSRQQVGYLEDLFVAASARGQGVGRALLEACAARGRQFGWRRLYWQTKADNATARVLYDQVAEATDWVRYDWDLGELNCGPRSP